MTINLRKKIRNAIIWVVRQDLSISSMEDDISKSIDFILNIIKSENNSNLSNLKIYDIAHYRGTCDTQVLMFISNSESEAIKIYNDWQAKYYEKNKDDPTVKKVVVFNRENHKIIEYPLNKIFDFNYNF